MPGKIRFPVHLLILFAFIFLIQGRYGFAQQMPFLNKKISFTFTDIPLPDVLRAIGNKTGVKFSYNPDLVRAERHISMKFSNLPLHDVLKQLFPDPTISFREIGNQIVVYRGTAPAIQLGPNQKLVQGKPKVVLPNKKTPDTVFVYQLDTLYISLTDTVLQKVPITYYDTVRIVDTVYIENNAFTQKNEADTGFMAVSDTSILPKKPYFFSGLYLEFLPGQATYGSGTSQNGDFAVLMKNANQGNLAKYSVGLMAGFNYPKFGIHSGFGFTQIGEKFGYSYFLESGGYYQVAIGDTFYTNEGGVLVPHYVIADSTWVPKDVKDYTYQGRNTYRYLDVPLSVKYSFWKGKAMDVYAKVGINLSFLVSVNASHINPVGINYVVQTRKPDLNPMLFSWDVGLGAAFPVTSRTGMLAEATYYAQKTEQYRSLPVDKRYNLFGLKVAAYFKF